MAAEASEPRFPAERQILAQVVELVDTQVSEACALTAWGFESPLGHQIFSRVGNKFVPAKAELACKKRQYLGEGFEEAPRQQ